VMASSMAYFMVSLHGGLAQLAFPCWMLLPMLAQLLHLCRSPT
jgi:hypothetical protein